jgi:hypothetical protein
MFTERYGPIASVQKWLRGVLATIAFKVSTTNCSLEARAFEFAPVDETPD